MDYRTLFDKIRRRPGLYGLDGSFGQFTAFISGVDAGNDWQLLTGFREWLIVRLGYGNNLTWPGLVLWVAIPEDQPDVLDRLKDPEHNRVASETLFQLLDEFLDRRVAHGSPPPSSTSISPGAEPKAGTSRPAPTPREVCVHAGMASPSCAVARAG